jgi:hypothetical protein
MPLMYNINVIQYSILVVRLNVKFLKSELNSYSVCEFRGLTFKKKLNKI